MEQVEKAEQLHFECTRDDDWCMFKEVFILCVYLGSAVLQRNLHTYLFIWAHN